jgi:hypothetical protein
MKRPSIIAISVAVVMGLATTCWAAEGAGSETPGSASGTGSTGSGSGMNKSGMTPNGSGMKSNSENKGLPGGHQSDDLNKPGNGDHGNNGANGG